MSAARGGEIWTSEEYVFYCLKGLAALASDLFWGVLFEKSLGVLSSERVPCNESVEGRMGKARERSFFVVFWVRV